MIDDTGYFVPPATVEYGLTAPGSSVPPPRLASAGGGGPPPPGPSGTTHRLKGPK